VIYFCSGVGAGFVQALNCASHARNWHFEDFLDFLDTVDEDAVVNGEQWECWC
jgi:hypothetical protein